MLLGAHCEVVDFYWFQLLIRDEFVFIDCCGFEDLIALALFHVLKFLVGVTADSKRSGISNYGFLLVTFNDFDLDILWEID